MKKVRNLVVIALLIMLVAGLVFAGGGGQRGRGPDRPYRIVFTMFSGTNPVAREIETGFRASANEMGINLWVMDNELDPIRMHANVDMAIAAGDVDFYVLYTNDVQSNPALMDKLVAAGIPVMTIGTEGVAANVTRAPQLFGEEDNYNSAFLAAESLAKAAQAKGWNERDLRFISMGFLEAGGVFLIRTRGAEAGMRSVFPNIEYIETSSTGSPQVAFQRTADSLMTLAPGRKLLGWTHSDDVTASMLAAIEGAGRVNDALLVSNGFVMSMLDMVRAPDSIIVGTIDYSFSSWGGTILEYAVDYLRNGTPIPPIVAAPYILLTPQNVNSVYPR